MKIPDRLRAVLIEAILTEALRTPFNAEQAPGLPDGWELCWCTDCSASVVVVNADGVGLFEVLLDKVALLMHEDECPWSWLATPDPAASDYRLQRVEPWDGLNPPDYVSPVKPGDRVVLVYGDDTLLVTRVVRVEGYSPDVIEVEGQDVIDLAGGWRLGIIE